MIGAIAAAVGGGAVNVGGAEALLALNGGGVVEGEAFEGGYFVIVDFVFAGFGGEVDLFWGGCHGLVVSGDASLPNTSSLLL